MPRTMLQSCLLMNRGHRQEGESGDSKCKSCMRKAQILLLVSELIVLPAALFHRGQDLGKRQRRERCGVVGYPVGNDELAAVHEATA